MAKRAVVIGINYPGTKAELKGCVNDARFMYDILVEHFEFPEDNITLLVDQDNWDPNTHPTAQNIVKALVDLVQSAEPGDVLYVHYSGHGTRARAKNDEDDNTGWDECIVGSDDNLIKDDDFRALVDAVPEGCHLTIVSDSCCSGGLIEQAKEQIGESEIWYNGEKAWEGDLEPPQDQEEGGEAEEEVSSRFLPVETLVSILQEKTGREDLEEGMIWEALSEAFGEEANPSFKNFFNTGDEECYYGPISDKGILISGCQSSQVSLEAQDSNGNPGGALSIKIREILQETNYQISNRELVLRIRQKLWEDKSAQRPGLYCEDDLADAPFIC